MLTMELASGSDIKGEIFACQAIDATTIDQTCHALKAFKATLDPDTLYLHEAVAGLAQIPGRNDKRKSTTR